MGLELIIGAVSAAASIVTGVMSLNAASQAANERKEANNVSNAQQKNQNVDSIRKAVRESRVRRAAIMQQSVNSGLGTNGSGTMGAVGAVGTNLGSNVATASQQGLAADGINQHNQRAADFDFESQMWGSIGSIFSSAIGAFGTKQRKPPSYATVFDEG